MIDTTPLDQGIAAENAATQGTSAEEMADVKKRLKDIADARTFDENARIRYALDRKYANGDGGEFDVVIEVAPSYIDVLTAFLYANDPDLDIQPAPGTNPPPMADVLKMARAQVMADPATQIAMEQAGAQAAQQATVAAAQTALGAVAGIEAPPPPDGAAPMPPPNPQMAGQQAAQTRLDELVKARANVIMAPHKQRLSDAKQIGQTIETVVSQMWQQAFLKAAADDLVRSGLTVAIGWLKAAWQERAGKDPLVVQKMNDLQDNIARLASTVADMREQPNDLDAKKAELQLQLDGLQADVEVVVARGLAIDFVAAEDMQVSLDVPKISQYRDAGWNAHRTFMPYCEAKVKFPQLCKEGDNKLAKATVYFARKPADPRASRDVGSVADNVNASDADAYTSGSTITGGMSADRESGNVCVWEQWDKTCNSIITLMEGLDCYARPPFTPNPPTTRFYPFFQYAPIKVDGRRHPKSLIERSETLLDDTNRLYSNRSLHRRRSIPKTVFDRSNLTPEDASRIEAGGTQEMIGVEPVVPGSDVKQMVAPLAYAPIDEALYDDSKTRAALEMLWGIQEALGSSIQTPKTLGEAEIQQKGTEARTDYKRDNLDEMLTDLATYSAEIALQKMTHDDVVRIAGPFAMWPQNIGVEDLRTLVTVKIRAGSSGKPDTTAQREAWAQVMPIIQANIIQIGQLRGSSPEAIADCLEELVQETLARTGDRIDAARFLPSAPDNGGMTPPPAPMGAPPPTEVPAPQPGAPLQ
ncbi:MAG: hypothetical protein ACREPX_05120 [Rhodanobacteraceae bacterium]